MSTIDPTPAHFIPLREAPDYFQVSARTPEQWARKKYIRLYRSNDGTLVVNVDEIERALRLHGRTKMRDGRRRYGVPVAPMPVTAKAADQ